jgi:hypothetical protein
MPITAKLDGLEELGRFREISRANCRKTYNATLQAIPYIDPLRTEEAIADIEMIDQFLPYPLPIKLLFSSSVCKTSKKG